MPKMLITGGAGFIGVNAAAYFAEKGWSVDILDNLSRQGTQLNLDWLQQKTKVGLHRVDIRDAAAVETVVAELKPDALLHLAAQVAVTTSVTNPRFDFETNALGTFNVIEAVRVHSPKTFILNASTNKVYGKMEDLEITERNGRHEYSNCAGVDEQRALDFHSPYGCSKGVADQYVIDYARIYGLDTVTFRQSCIYGTRQFGVEDQGWVAWFTIAAMLDKQITIYGDGKQVRDVLHVDDLLRAYEAAIENRDKARGQAFNIGGGPQNTLSLLELLGQLQSGLKKNIPVNWSDWRPGDQLVYVSSIEKLESVLGWTPRIRSEDGVQHLITWVRENKGLFDWLK